VGATPKRPSLAQAGEGCLRLVAIHGTAPGLPERLLIGLMDDTSTAWFEREPETAGHDRDREHLGRQVLGMNTCNQ